MNCISVTVEDMNGYNSIKLEYKPVLYSSSAELYMSAAHILQSERSNSTQILCKHIHDDFVNVEI